MSQSIYLTALHHHQNNALQEAESLYAQVLLANPKHADALHYLGVIHYQTGRYKEAIIYIQQAIQINAQTADYYNHLGLSLSANCQTAEAIVTLKSGLKLNPKDFSLQKNLANILFEAERYEEAAGYYRRLYRASRRDPELAATLALCLLNLGNQCAAKGAYSQAEASFEEALLYNPNEINCYYNLGNAQRELGKIKEAEKHYLHYLKQQPNDADAYNNLGNVQREQGKLADAIASYQTALQINPELFHAMVHLVHQKQHACDWAGLNSDIAQIRDWVVNKRTAQISPFAFLSMPTTTEAEQLQCANNWLINRYASLMNTTPKFDFSDISQRIKPHRKLKIGYLSADFRLHPLAFLITELIELHDHRQFEVYAYSYGVNDKTPERKRLEKAFDRFRDIRHLSISDAAQQIYADQIDILIDLTGFTQSSRTSIVALKPAPLSINWLGFPGTMGKIDDQPLFDYLITDSTITPPESAQFYAEALIYLPCYQPIDHKRPKAKVPNRADYQLPEQAFVFCSFNQSFKINAETFAVWMRCLAQVPNSVLWLLECNALAKANLLREAAAHGIAANRLIFAPREATAKHLARQPLADLMLDTLPYNAHTTASDALLAGLPLLTLQGDTFSGRVATSLLKAAGLPELITYDLQTYEAKALALARNRQDFLRIRQKLTQNLQTDHFFNTHIFVKGLEDNLQAVWIQYLHSRGV